MWAKTRLASTVGAALVDHFEAGVRFVKLAPVSDPQQIPAAFAQALAIKDDGKQPLLQSVKRYLRDKSLLLVADNFEQLLDAAIFLAELLETCPRLKILVTSRSLLQIYGEYEFSVPPLSLPISNVALNSASPDIAALNKYEAIALFVQRARAARHGFALNKDNAQAVIKICQYLDGLPLALELAAARLKLFSPAELLQQLTANNAAYYESNRLRLEILSNSDRFLTPRQRAITNTIEWSYQLLKPHENCLALHKELEEVKADTSAVSLDGTYNSLGVLMLHEGQLDLAEEYFKLALDLFPEILVPTKTRFS